MPEDLNSVLISFEDFAKLDLNKPIKILPEGTWYRGERELKVTAARLQEMAKNFNEGIPNFRVGINKDHTEDEGKVGDIKSVAYMPEGEKGAGLYATEYDLTPKGITAVEDDGYDGVSAEVVWSLNHGASYQDPKTGLRHDNVLVGLALTPTPFFGHGETALYKSERGQKVERQYWSESGEWRNFDGAQSFPEYDQWSEAQDKEARISETNWIFRELFENIWSDEDLEVEEKVAKTTVLGSQLLARLEAGGEEFRKMVQAELAKKRAEADNTDPVPDDGKTKSDEKETDEMSILEKIAGMFSSENTDALKAQIEAGELTVDEVVERLGNANAEALLGIEALTPEVEEEETTEELDVETDTDELAAERDRADKLQAELDAERLAKRKAALKSEVEGFKALGIEAEEYVDNMSALEDHSEDLATWLRERFATIDKTLYEGGLLVELGSDAESDAETDTLFVRRVQNVIKEEFEGDMTKWPEAMAAVSKQHPDLAEAYGASVP